MQINNVNMPHIEVDDHIAVVAQSGPLTVMAICQCGATAVSATTENIKRMLREKHRKAVSDVVPTED
jgi:hypothetical protein